MSKTKQNLALLAILLGTFIVPVNSTMISVALSTMAESFALSFRDISWLVTIYLIIMTVTQPLAGKLGDLFGNRRLFLIGTLLFMLASMICIIAEAFWVLLLGRALQAIGGALITPNATALLRFITPKEQLTKTFGIFGFSMSIGAAIGPIIGALLISTWNWQATFWVNIPLLALSFLCALTFLPKSARQQAPIDFIGALLLAIWLSSFIYMLINAYYTAYALWLIIVVAFSLFIYRERTFHMPLIDFKLFKSPNFRYANGAILLTNGVMYGTLLFMPLVLKQFSLNEIGIALFAFSISISICSYIGGRLEEKWGIKRLIQLSFLSSFAAIILFMLLPTTQSLVVVIGIMLLAGIGSGLGVPSMQAASLLDVAKEQTGVASGIYSTFRYIGSTLISVIVGMQLVFSTTIIIFLCCTLLGLALSRGFISKTA